MFINASSLTKLRLVSILFICLGIVGSVFASNNKTSSTHNQMSLALEQTIKSVDAWQIEDIETQGRNNDLSNNSVRIDKEKLMKLTLLVAQYRQAYEEAKQKLERALRINEDLINAYKKQDQIIEEMESRISSMKKEVMNLRSKDNENTVPIPPLNENSSPTALNETYKEPFLSTQIMPLLFQKYP